MSVWSDIADWVGPSPNKYPGAEQTPAWVVLHIQEGTDPGTIAWQRNPASQVSSHFLAPKQGRLQQMLDTADASWSVVDGNLRALSIECEGYSGDSLTGDQIESCAQVLARAHRDFGVPLTAVAPPAPGLTGHGLGGAAWGGHYDCPGQPILDQRPQVIARAAQILGGAGANQNPNPTPLGGSMAVIPPSIGQFWPEIAGQFPAGQSFDNDTALIWADGGARAAALYAKETRDAVTALAARVGAPAAVDVNALAQAVASKVGAPPAVDVAALAQALAPHLTAGASADQLAQAVARHLGADLANG